MGRTGRRRGPNLTRAAILEAARRQFAGAGYDGASMRAIAAEAGVDPGMVLHYFGTKEELFRQAVGWPFDPTAFAVTINASQRSGLGGRLAEAFFGFWEDPVTREPLMAILRSALQHETSEALLREFVARQLWQYIDGPDAGLRTNLAASQLIGIALTRYLVRIEPIASVPISEVLDLVSPVLDQYLAPSPTGEQGAVRAAEQSRRAGPDPARAGSGPEEGDHRSTTRTGTAS